MKKNWYGFNHESVNKHFKGELTYLNDFCVNGEYNPVAVYKCKRPDKSKGHKKYILLQIIDKKTLIRGMDLKTIKQFSKAKVVQCKKCKDTIYSVMRHDFRSCECGNITIDGGTELFHRILYKKLSQYKTFTVDLLKWVD